MGSQWVLFALLFLSLVGTILRQFPRVSASKALRWDSLGLFPGFSFFAPEPGSRDYVLVYRTQTNNVPNAWREAFPLRHRNPMTAVWNPDKRLRKAIIDVSGALAQEFVDGPPSNAQVMLSVPYLLILQYVSSLASEIDTKVQFAILTSAGSSGMRNIELLILSQPHAVRA
jgi:hypothetical protein